MTNKELTKHLLKGLRFCNSCRFAVKIDLKRYDPLPPPGTPKEECDKNLTGEKIHYVCLREKDWLTHNQEYRDHCEKWEIESEYESDSSYSVNRLRRIDDRIVFENVVIDISIDSSLHKDRRCRAALNDFQFSLRDTFNPGYSQYRWKNRKTTDMIEGVIYDGI
jgi:hypothetical protein